MALTAISGPVSLDLMDHLTSDSNRRLDEILLSSDKTVAIIDGSGVLHDPFGINRTELVRLARLRVPVSHFDISKLSQEGYLVKVEEHDIKLPCEFVMYRSPRLKLTLV